MPKLRNNEDFDIWCHAIKQIVPAKGVVDVSVEDAEFLNTGLVFDVLNDDGEVVRTDTKETDVLGKTDDEKKKIAQAVESIEADKPQTVK